jgi:hypothetical protein
LGLGLLKDWAESMRFIPAPTVGWWRYFCRLLRIGNYSVIELLFRVGVIAVAIIAIPHYFISKFIRVIINYNGR